MAFSQWWSFSESMVNIDRDEGGVYEFSDSAGEIIYIGSTGELKKRLKRHLSESAKSCIRVNAARYRIDYRGDYAAEELRLYNEFVRTYGRAPRCNEIRPPG